MQISISKFSLIFSFAFTASIFDHGLKKLSYVNESGRHDKRRNRCGIEGKDSISLDSISLDSAQERVHHFLRILVTRFPLTMLFFKRFAAFRGLQECRGPSILSTAGVLDLVVLSDLQLLLILLDPVLAEALAHVATTPTEENCSTTEVTSATGELAS